jgi:hypothetical protein
MYLASVLMVTNDKSIDLKHEVLLENVINIPTNYGSYITLYAKN